MSLVPTSDSSQRHAPWCSLRPLQNAPWCSSWPHLVRAKHVLLDGPSIDITRGLIVGVYWKVTHWLRDIQIPMDSAEIGNQWSATCHTVVQCQWAIMNQRRACAPQTTHARLVDISRPTSLFQWAIRSDGLSLATLRFTSEIVAAPLMSSPHARYVPCRGSARMSWFSLANTSVKTWMEHSERQWSNSHWMHANTHGQHYPWAATFLRGQYPTGGTSKGSDSCGLDPNHPRRRNDKMRAGHATLLGLENHWHALHGKPHPEHRAYKVAPLTAHCACEAYIC